MSEIAETGSEAKFYPNTAHTIQDSLTIAKATHDRLGVDTVLSQKTIDSLNTMEPLFRQSVANLAKLTGEYLTLTLQKEKARTDTILHTSHFLQVFNLGVKRGKYAASERALFGLHVSSEVLPNFQNDDNIRAAAWNIVEGETKRIADGMPAVTNPSGAEVEAAYNTFQQLTQLTSNANVAFIDAQIAMRDLKKKGRNLVKHIWREVETHYNEGERPRMRKWARGWGVIYARKGGEKTVSGTITDAATGLPVPAVKVKFAKGKNKTISDMQGHFKLVTNLLHKQTLLTTRIHYSTAETIIDLKEGEENVCVVKMERSEN